MNVNKKLGRFKQWAGERMGGEVKTTLSNDFKAMEQEMNMRQEGLNANHKAMTGYVKSLSQRTEGEDKEKMLPVAHLGAVQMSHGEEFDPESEYGRCLIAMGRTHDRISRIQETYISQANSSWLDSLERSQAQMKEYQSARKKLESRRLAYDTAQGKLQKAKREDYRAEEEARSQKIKFEESNEDVIRRMEDFQELEPENLADLGEFLEAELNYHARCHEALLQLKREWPAGGLSRASTRSFSPIDEVPETTERRAVRSVRSAQASVNHSPQREFAGIEVGGRPGVGRATSYDTPARDSSPMAGGQRIMRTPSDNLSIRTQKAQLRSTARRPSADVFDDPSDHSGTFTNGTSSPERAYGDRAASPATSVGSSTGSAARRKPPPPPPPSRSTKPPPPPPPAKRSGLCATQVQT